MGKSGNNVALRLRLAFPPEVRVVLGLILWRACVKCSVFRSGEVVCHRRAAYVCRISSIRRPGVGIKKVGSWEQVNSPTLMPVEEKRYPLLWGRGKGARWLTTSGYRY